jgi:hypothetical protein
VTAHPAAFAGPSLGWRLGDQRSLYRANRSVPDAETYARMWQTEGDWVVRQADQAERSTPDFGSRAELMSALHDLLREEEAAGMSESERFLAAEATRIQFAVVVGQFAVDGLVESHAHLGIVPRLPPRARMAVFRVLVDEFGCGHDDQEHAGLYGKLLAELGLPRDLAHYVERATDECLAYVNLFYWLAHRAPTPEYFLGAYAYFESSVLYGYRCYADATERLGIRERGYYLEHLYIDGFHSKQMQASIGALEQERPVDLRQVWAGVQLTRSTIAAATDAAVALARRAGS